MANEQNLIPGGHKFTQEEASRGGIASGKKRRLMGAIEKALDGKAPEEYEELFKTFNIEGEKTFSDAVACAIVSKAAKGDLYAASFIRDTIGEKPKEEISLDGGVVIVDDLAGKT